ncbi:unnamed protein product (macronuclear) [Paramecium tetraurelia]|uniref:Transmembrane protein n=1 Tax=Paramecium tetraurelia TaxID=5888 RepID=A0CY81_PARTE|nr:uncharacterized protein GSPATT00039086001 [Paramecium tetraurelia]CAK75748.1 unnamed protein product [Paramecium tetraurelia]|eukprot:XP_001443145.1 hypothetical protein (macronuclear) [Paramecium tetraurelia strain d4-2]
MFCHKHILKIRKLHFQQEAFKFISKYLTLQNICKFIGPISFIFHQNNYKQVSLMRTINFIIQSRLCVQQQSSYMFNRNDSPTASFTEQLNKKHYTLSIEISKRTKLKGHGFTNDQVLDFEIIQLNPIQFSPTNFFSIQARSIPLIPKITFSYLDLKSFVLPTFCQPICQIIWINFSLKIFIQFYQKSFFKFHRTYIIFKPYLLALNRNSQQIKFFLPFSIEDLHLIQSVHQFYLRFLSILQMIL